MDSQFLLSAALWLLWWLAVIGVSGFVMIVVARIVLRATLEVWKFLRSMTALIVHHSSQALAAFVIDGMKLALFYSVKGGAWVFAPLNRKWNTAKDSMKEEQKWKAQAQQEWTAMTNWTDLVKQAKAIMGLPEQFDATDLRSRYIRLMKLFHPDNGVGTEYLAQQVNWANDVLKRVLR